MPYNPYGAGAALTTPVAPATAAAPAGGGIMAGVADRWRNFLTQLQTDPNLRMALLQTGTGLMQTPQVGQSGWDVAGQALQRGALTLHTLREQQRQQRESEMERQRQYDLERQRAEAYGEVAKAQVTSAEAGAGESKARTRKYEQELDPTTLDLERRKGEADIRKTEAETEAERAHAGYWGRGSPGGAGGSGKQTDFVEIRDALADELRSLNPSWTEEQVNAEATRRALELKNQRSKMFERSEALRKERESISPVYWTLTPEQQAAVDVQAARNVDLAAAEQRKQEAARAATQGVEAAAVFVSKNRGKSVPYKTASGKSGTAKIFGVGPNGTITLALEDGRTTEVALQDVEKELK